MNSNTPALAEAAAPEKRTSAGGGSGDAGSGSSSTSATGTSVSASGSATPPPPPTPLAAHAAIIFQEFAPLVARAKKALLANSRSSAWVKGGTSRRGTDLFTRLVARGSSVNSPFLSLFLLPPHSPPHTYSVHSKPPRSVQPRSDRDHANAMGRASVPFRASVIRDVLCSKEFDVSREHS